MYFCETQSQYEHDLKTLESNLSKWIGKLFDEEFLLLREIPFLEEEKDRLVSQSICPF
jgi:hypothetical protein